MNGLTSVFLVFVFPIRFMCNLQFRDFQGKKNPGTDRDSVLSFLSRVLRAKEMKIDRYCSSICPSFLVYIENAMGLFMSLIIL